MKGTVNRPGAAGGNREVNSNRQTYHVEPVRAGGWQVKQEATSWEVEAFSTKEEAIDRARDLAQAQGEGRVIVHRDDGSIEDDFSIGGETATRPDR